MMCGHCQKHVQETLEKIKGVEMSRFKTLITDFLATELARQEYVDVGVSPFYGEQLPDETFN